MSKQLYNIYQKDVFGLMKTGGKLQNGEDIDAHDFFLTSISLEFETIAINHGCRVELNPDRLVDCHRVWVEDIGKMKIDGGGLPDQFKHAGLLAYWLRRKVVIEKAEKFIVYDTDKGIEHQAHFLQYPSEMAGFLLGLSLSAHYTYAVVRETIGSIDSYIYKIRPSDNLIYDTAHYMNEKHVSPHSLYLIYRVIFEQSLKNILLLR